MPKSTTASSAGRAIGFYRAHGWTADGGEKFGEGGSVQGLRELRLVKALTAPAG